MIARADPKPGRRRKARRAPNPQVAAKMHSEVSCRCGCGRRATDAHHLVLRSLGGLDVPANAVRLAHECHMRFHGSPDGRETVGAGIRVNLSGAEMSHMLMAKGCAYVARYYPLRAS